MLPLTEIPIEIIESHVFYYLPSHELGNLRLASKIFAENIWEFVNGRKVPKALGWPFPTDKSGIVQVPNKMKTWPLALKTGTVQLPDYSYTCFTAYVSFDENPFNKEPFSWYHYATPDWIFIHLIADQIASSNYTIDKLSFVQMNSCSIMDIKEFIQVLGILKNVSMVEYYGNSLRGITCNKIIGEFAGAICTCKCRCLDLSNTDLTLEFLSTFIHHKNLSLTTLIVKGNFIEDQHANIRKLLDNITVVF